MFNLSLDNRSGFGTRESTGAPFESVQAMAGYYSPGSEEQFRNRAYILGFMGLGPIISGVIILAISPGHPWVLASVHHYAAVILTFLGAIHWGRALQSNDVRLITLSVIPSLIAWVSLSVTVELAILYLMAAFVAQFLFDYHHYQQQWFIVLRARLTAIICGLLAVVPWLN